MFLKTAASNASSCLRQQQKEKESCKRWFGCMQASRQDQVQNVAQKALALLAATQMLAAGL